MTVRPKSWDRGNIYLSGGMQFAQNLGAGWRELTSAKLKEMEYMEKIADKIGDITVSGNSNIVSQLKEIFAK